MSSAPDDEYARYRRRHVERLTPEQLIERRREGLAGRSRLVLPEDPLTEDVVFEVRRRRRRTPR